MHKFRIDVKKIEAVIQEEKINAVTGALKSVGVGGYTVLNTKGRGSGERPTIRGGRGTVSYVSEYSKGHSVSTIVDESLVNDVISAISKSAFTGKAGDGIIYVKNVEDVLNIASKKRGSEAL
jgi:nitrogen regulatory protein PII